MKANRSNIVPPFGVVPVPYVIPGDARQSRTRVTTLGGACSENRRGITAEIASAPGCLAMTGKGTLAMTPSLLQGE
jgi:hypothetical protein